MLRVESRMSKAESLQLVESEVEVVRTSPSPGNPQFLVPRESARETLDETTEA